MDRPDNIEQLFKDGRKADSQDRERAEAWQEMIATKGWAFLAQFINTKLQMSGEMLLQPLSSMDHTLAQEHMKGAMWAFALIRDLPANTIAAMNAAQDAEEPNND